MAFYKCITAIGYRYKHLVFLLCAMSNHSRNVIRTRKSISTAVVTPKDVYPGRGKNCGDDGRDNKEDISLVRFHERGQWSRKETERKQSGRLLSRIAAN
jgi:hypothetical protein